MNESPRQEYKADYDGSAKARLQLVKEVVAFSNSGGGVLTIGKNNAGEVLGVDRAAVDRLDAARIDDLLKAFTAPDLIEVEVTVEAVENELFVVQLHVPSFPRPPVVMAKDGQRDQHGKPVSEFRQGDVYVRTSTKAERASRRHYEGWTERAIESERERWMARIEVLRSLGPDDTIQPVFSGQPRDEPTALIENALAQWRRDSTKLLSARDLALLLLTNSDGLRQSHARDLILHSALRRRATLWHWLALFVPSPGEIQTILLEAIAGKDRDKSDAGRAIIEVSAAMLDNDRHEQVVRSLGESSYLHFRQAANEGGDRSAVLQRLRDQRNTPKGGTDLRKEGEASLIAASREALKVLVTDGKHLAEARALSRIGIELFARSPVGESLR